MTRLMANAWEEVLKPMIFRPKRVQIAALCLRESEDGLRVLMITSRGTGRWILPKGWPVSGKDGAQSAEQEAWEEAGVRDASVLDEPVGRYEYVKQFEDGSSERVETYVYQMTVEELAREYPESLERVRRWMHPKEAANLVEEPQLRDLLLEL